MSRGRAHHGCACGVKGKKRLNGRQSVSSSGRRIRQRHATTVLCISSSRTAQERQGNPACARREHGKLGAWSQVAQHIFPQKGPYRSWGLLGGLLSASPGARTESSSSQIHAATRLAGGVIGGKLHWSERESRQSDPSIVTFTLFWSQANLKTRARRNQMSWVYRGAGDTRRRTLDGCDFIKRTRNYGGVQRCSLRLSEGRVASQGKGQRSAAVTT